MYLGKEIASGKYWFATVFLKKGYFVGILHLQALEAICKLQNVATQA
jgi:hypothetical protein